MELKELLGENYKEDMTFADIETAFSGLNLVDPSTLPKTVDKTMFDKTASELAAYKKKERDRMTEEEQRAAREKEQQELFAQLKADKCRLLMEREFASGGFTQKEWEPLIDAFNADDPDKAVSYAQSLVAFHKDSMKSIEQKIKDELNANMGRPQANNNTESIKAAYLQAYREAQEKNDFVAMASITEQAAAKGIQI